MTEISQAGGADIVLTQDGSGSVFYTTDGVTQSQIVSWPVTIVNSTLDGTFVNVKFPDLLTLSTNDQYFVCGSAYIQFGITVLRQNGEGSSVSVQSTAYPGLIQNGTSTDNGKSNIRVFNLRVTVAGAAQYAGVIGQRYYARTATYNHIVNCRASGVLDQYCGGIVGSDAANNGSLYIEGCFCDCFMEVRTGGIVGQRCSNAGGTVECVGCVCISELPANSGGIFGQTAGRNGGTAIATRCFSSGAIGEGSGGIFGPGPQGPCTATNCYSTGSIGLNAGGIFGVDATADCQLTNCYSTGIINGGGGLVGSNSSAIVSHCYAAAGSWTDRAASGADALTGTPASNGYGSSWVSLGVNQPYLISTFGFTPYDSNIIRQTEGTLVTSFALTISGFNTKNASVRDQNYQLIQLSGPSTATIDINTGVITVRSNGTYDLIIINSETTVTSLTLQVGGGPQPEPAQTNWGAVAVGLGALIGVRFILTRL